MRYTNKKLDQNYKWNDCNDIFKEFWVNNDYYPRAVQSFETRYNFESFCSQYGLFTIKKWILNSPDLWYYMNSFKNAPCKSNKLSTLKTVIIYDSTHSITDRKQFCIFNDDRLEDLIKYALERIPNHTEIEYYKNFVKTGLYNFLNELL